MNHTAVTYYGAPNTVWIRYTVRKGDATNPGNESMIHKGNESKIHRGNE